MADNGYGELAAALAKAQAAFPAIQRDKEVTVQTKAGGSYKFKYAPLDSILTAVRAPLADNGLAIVQLLDEDTLVTSLLHASGAILSGRTPIPQTEGVQAYGSAITYLRRYSIQALLGIAAEEDDDGNQAAGNRITSGRAPREPRNVSREEAAANAARAESNEPSYVGPFSATGEIVVRKTGQSDGNLRQGPDGGYFIVAFKTTDGEGIPQVLVRDPLAVDLLDAAGADLNGLVCTIEGDEYSVPFRNGDFSRPFKRVHLAHIKTAGWSLPEPAAAEVQPSGQAHAGSPSPEEDAELDGALDGALVLPLGQS